MVEYSSDAFKALTPIFLAEEGEARNAAWRKAFTEDVPKTLGFLEARLEKVGTGYLAGDKATIADYVFWQYVTSFLDNEFIRDSVVDTFAPFPKVKEFQALGRTENAAHYERTASLPFIPFIKEKLAL